MTVSRREGLVRLARKYDALVICDDVYDFLQWPVVSPLRPSSPSSPHAPPPTPTPLPRLVDIDLALGPDPCDPRHFGHAISNGTFSKIVSPGMRTGWVEASPAFAFGLAQTGSTYWTGSGRSGRSAFWVSSWMMTRRRRCGLPPAPPSLVSVTP